MDKHEASMHFYGFLRVTIAWAFLVRIRGWMLPLIVRNRDKDGPETGPWG